VTLRVPDEERGEGEGEGDGEEGGEERPLVVSDMCVVCFEPTVQVAVQPCNHQCLCLECACALVPLFVQGVRSVQACAVCRRPIRALRVTDKPLEPAGCVPYHHPRPRPNPDVNTVPRTLALDMQAPVISLT
jgi:hypothetical protein